MSKNGSIKKLRSVEEIQGAIDALKKKAAYMQSKFFDADASINVDDIAQSLSWVLGNSEPDFEESLTYDLDAWGGNSVESGLNELYQHLDFLCEDLEAMASVAPESYFIHAAACGLSLVQEGISKWFDEQKQAKSTIEDSPPTAHPG